MSVELGASKKKWPLAITFKKTFPWLTPYLYPLKLNFHHRMWLKVVQTDESNGYKTAKVFNK